MNKLDRQAREILTSAGRKDLADRVGPKRSVLKPKSKRPALLSRGQRVEERIARVAAIREAVMERADDWCELCKSEPADELHHIISGSGLRRKHEDASTCVALGEACHRALHRNDIATFEALVAWCRSYGSTLALQHASRRLEKVRRLHAKETL